MAADMEALYRAAVGEKKADFYVPRFLAIDAGQRGWLGWHWPAFFVTLPWLLWRRMWAMAGLYVVVPAVLAFALQLVVIAISVDEGGAESMVAGGIVGVLVVVALWVVPPMLATRLYHYHVNDRIKELQRKRKHQRADTSQAALEEALWLQPHVSKLGAGVFVLLSFGIFGPLAALALPAYQAYVLRAQTASVHSAAQAMLTEGTGEAADGLDWSQWDGKKVSAGANGKVSGTLQYDGEYEVVELTIESGHESLVGDRLWFEPELDDDGTILRWECSSPDIDDSKLPRACKSYGD